jgi:hypothetical protein
MVFFKELSIIGYALCFGFLGVPWVFLGNFLGLCMGAGGFVGGFVGVRTGFGYLMGDSTVFWRALFLLFLGV